MVVRVQTLDQACKANLFVATIITTIIITIISSSSSLLLPGVGLGVVVAVRKVKKFVNIYTDVNGYYI